MTDKREHQLEHQIRMVTLATAFAAPVSSEFPTNLLSMLN